MNQSIYPVRSQELHNLFNKIEHRKILVVPIDFAKDIHEAQVCRGTGQYLLRKPLRVHNSLKGLDFLQGKLKKSCRRYGIEKSSVIVCGEDPCSFSANFIHGLKLRGYTFIRVNAKEASKLRQSSRASTNELDLNGIAQAAIHRRGYETIDYTSVYTSLKETTRSRRRLVKQMTMLKNQIHSLIDVLLPGFLSKAKTDLEPFCNASLALMADNFSAIKIQHMRIGRLKNVLKKNRIRNPEGIAGKLKELCSQAAPPPPEPAVLNLPRDCNHRLKNAFTWVAKHIGRYAHPIRRESTSP